MSDPVPNRGPAGAVTPQVSVIVPFLNGERFLEEAIDSVVAQTYSAWELLLIDDGSTDSSTAIARRYASLHPGRVIYLEHPDHVNRGVTATRNLGVRHARGRFLAMLDADDLWLPHKLSEQVALLEAHPEVGMLYGDSLYWYSWTGDPRDATRDYHPPLGVAGDAITDSMRVLAGYLRFDIAVPCPCSVIARREIVEQVGGFEESFHTVLEDQAFFAKMLVAAPVYVASSQTWDRYRIHPDSACAVAERKGGVIEARLAYLDWLERYLKERDLARGEVLDALQADRWRCRNPRVAGAMTRLGRGAARVRARVRAALPEPTRKRLRRLIRPLGGVRFGNLRRTRPVSGDFGYERGLPVDRHYIEMFLGQHAADIQGRVLEIGDDSYMRQFGGDRVTKRDVLHVDERNTSATIIDDLALGTRIPSDAFDCVIFTQTLHLIYDLHAAVRTLHRILKPGGVMLATVPGISQLDAGEWGATWYWSFTPAAIRRLFSEVFPGAMLEVASHGNVLVACSQLQGLATEELSPQELAVHDPLYPLIVTIRARKPASESVT